MLRIIKEKTLYHLYSLESDYDQNLVEYCKFLKEALGWTELQWDGDNKKWHFKDPSIVVMLRSKFPEVIVSNEVDVEVVAYQHQNEIAIERDQNANRIKEAAVSGIEVKGIKGDLYEYQKLGIEFLINSGGRALLADSPGVGKTVQALGYITHSGHKRSLIVCPASVKFAWESEAEKWTSLKSFVVNPKTKLDEIDPDVNLIIINFDILKKFYKEFMKYDFDCMIVDEAHMCFPHKTMVMTDKGGISIGEIVEKRMNLNVASFNILTNEVEYEKVLNYFSPFNSERLVKVKHEYGEITCTESHKIYTNGGYKKAISLSSGEELRVLSEVICDKEKREKNSEILFPSLREYYNKFSSNRSEGITFAKGRQNRKEMFDLSKDLYRLQKPKRKFEKTFLWAQLFSKVENKTTLGNRKFEEGYKNSPKVQSGGKEPQGLLKDDRNEQEFRIQQEEMGRFLQVAPRKSNIPEPWWKWAVNKTSDNPNGVTKSTDGISNRDSKCSSFISIFTKFVQSRFGSSRKQDCNRGGRGVSQNEEMEIFGQKKNKGFRLSRVVSVEILEQGNTGESSGSGRSNKLVYNIEVEGNNNYFADNVLVSNCKSPTSTRAKVVKLLARHIPSFISLTGTPVLSRPIEMFNILNMIDPREWGNYYGFATRFCDGKQGYYGFEAKGASNLEELKARISKYFLRRTKEEVLSHLPPKNRIEIKIELPKEERTQYDLVESSLVKYLKEYKKDKTEKEIEKSLSAERLVKLNLLREINAMGKIPTAKELIDNILEADEKVIVLSSFNAPLKELSEMYEESSVLLLGETPIDERGAMVNKFQNNPNTNISFGGTRSAGVGITLTAAS